MCLSNETIEGLHITGMQWSWIVHNSRIYCILAVRSLVEVVRYLTNLPGVTGQYIL